MSVGEPALRELDYSTMFGWKPALRVKGAKVNLQTKGQGMDTNHHQLNSPLLHTKPSRIPRAVRKSECLPSDKTRGHENPISPHKIPPMSTTGAMELQKLQYSHQQDSTKLKISATEMQVPSRLILLQDKSNLRTKTRRRVEEGSIVCTKATGAQNGVIARKKVLKSTDKLVKQGSVGRQPQRRRNVESCRGGGARGKVTATSVVRNVKMMSGQDETEVKQVAKKVHKKRGTAMGKEAQEKMTQTKSRYCYLGQLLLCTST